MKKEIKIHYVDVEGIPTFRRFNNVDYDIVTLGAQDALLVVLEPTTTPNSDGRPVLMLNTDRVVEIEFKYEE